MKKQKSGFTILELVIVLIILSIVTGIAYQVITSQKSKAVATFAITTDLNEIQQAIQEIVLDDNSITNENISIYTSTNILYDETLQSLVSKSNGCHYYIEYDTVVKPNDAYKILLNCKNLFNQDENKIIEIKFASTVNKISKDKKIVIIDKKATSIGQSNASFTSSGTTGDGIVGARKMKL